MLVEDISFKEIVKALKNEDGRKVIANYGLDPNLVNTIEHFAMIVIHQ